MFSKEETCDKLKAGYLRQVEKVLSSVKSPRVKQVIEDIRLHLDQRFAELEPGRRTVENLQAIIAEMGAPSDYAELLASDAAGPVRRTPTRYFLAIALAGIVVVVAGWLLVPTFLKAPGFGSEQNSVLASVESQPMFGKKVDLPATSTIDENGLIVDKIDYPFVNDPEVLGAWESVDFVSDINNFTPAAKSFKGQLYLKELFILENGKTNWAFTWTRGLILSAPNKTASKYVVREIDCSTYMFFEWKSGDYTIQRMKPGYYVLKRRQPETS
ncbi:MAG: HAAS signaling domain-containing protein, partial [Planctomycetota bacterium]